MERNKLLSADYLDIIFDGRNKKYGGYELRRKYGSRARKATAFVLMSTTLAVTLPVIAANLSSDGRPSIVQIETPIHMQGLPPIKPEEQPPVSIPEPPAPVAIIEYPELRIVENDQVTEPPTAVEELQDKVVSLETHDGKPGDLEPGISGPSGNSNKVVDLPASMVQAPVRIVEIMPEFNGDLSRYLVDHLRYPEQARERGEEGKAGIEFVVNEDGSISNVTVIKKTTPSLDAEALRVVSGMPKWKPGRQGGKAVKVYFTLPIIFELQQ